MLEQSQRHQIIDLIRREVVPAMGCTEPIAVSLCTAHATELLGHTPTHIQVELSANILKNAMGVGIPGTGMIGLPIAIALGALIGKSVYQLEVLRDVTPEAVEKGKKYIAEKRIQIIHNDNCEDKLYIKVSVQYETEQAIAIIAGDHTRVVYLEKNGEVKLHEKGVLHTEELSHELPLNLRLVYDFATTTPLEEIDFILEARTLNEEAAKQALKGSYGHELGKTLSQPLGRGIMGNSIFSNILSTTSSACDARMAGALIPVMSNSGSGNQGICATLPVVVFAKENHNTEEQLTRALIISHLSAIYIKQSLGKLSALCGCVVASTGSSCGLTYLMGGSYEQIVYSVKNMIANLTGMICDGAKPSCTLKLTSGVSTAVLSAMLAIQQRCVTSAEGIIDDDVDVSIQNLTRIGAKAMNETDRTVLEIMTSKKSSSS